MGGWPDPEDEGILPFEYMSDAHRKIIAEKCSGQDDPSMPNVPKRKPKVAKTAVEVSISDLVIGFFFVKISSPLS